MATTKTEKLSQFVIIFIAISALLISIWQVRVSQTHNRLTVQPRLNIDSGTSTINSQQEFSITLTNHGFGPAMIKGFEIRVDGEIQSNWNEAVAKMGLQGTMTKAANLPENQVVAAGNEQILLTLIGYQGDNRGSLKITYESIYQEEFIVEESF